MLGVYGVSGKWYCCCHHNANPALNDAITAEIHRQQPMADHIVSLRRMGKADRGLEQQLIDAVREISQQPPLAPVAGPKSGETHFSEIDA
jgi:hypothetical protein